MNNKKFLTIIIVATIIMTIMGGTIEYVMENYNNTLNTYSDGVVASAFGANSISGSASLYGPSWRGVLVTKY